MDIEKLIKRHQQIELYGQCCTKERQQLAEEAIKYFQTNPELKRSEYFGIKNYAGFGDQRCDCTPGYGPTHGSIVFRIDYNRKNSKVDEDGIDYILTAIANPNIRISDLVSTYLNNKSKMEQAEQQIKELAEFDLNA